MRWFAGVCLVAACAPSRQPDDVTESFGIAVPHFTSADADAISRRHELGARWVRRDISWHQVELEPGVFDFTEADAVVDAERALGTKVLAILDYGHPTYSGNDDPHAPPKDVADFGVYAAAVAQHFRGRIAAYELWNEPNTPVFWPPWPDPAVYAELAMHAAARVRSVDSAATLVLGGMLGNLDPLLFGGRAWGFLEDVLSAQSGLLAAVDVVAIHPYTWLQYVPPEAASGTVASVQVGYKEMIAEVRRIVSDHGRADVPIWSTEQGWHTATDAVLTLGVSELEQAAYIVRAHVLALSLGVERVFQFTYSDEAGDLTDKESHFGLVRYATAEAKWAAIAYSTMVSLLEGKHFAGDVRADWGLGEQSYAFAFEGARRVVVAWCVDSAGDTLILDEKPRRIVDMLGEASPRARKVQLSWSPVYVVLD